MNTIYLSDYEIERLNDGYSVNVAGNLITFATGSKRCIVKGDEQ